MDYVKQLFQTNVCCIIYHCFLLFLVLGIGAGGATTYVLTRNDTFEIIGENVISKAKEACNNSDISSLDHFVGSNKTIKMPKTAQKEVIDYEHFQDMHAT